MQLVDHRGQLLAVNARLGEGRDGPADPVLPARRDESAAGLRAAHDADRGRCGGRHPRCGSRREFPAADPFPFEFLNFVLAVEAIILSTVVLMAQNRQGRESAEQAELHFQIGLLAEQETTKMLEMLREIHTKLGLGAAAKDPELREMIQTTQVELIADELKRSRTEEEPSSEMGPV